MTVDKILGQYDAPTLRRLFDEAGVLGALAQRGFSDLEVVVEGAGVPLPHTVLFGSKQGTRARLIDAIVAEATVAAAALAPLGYTTDRALELVVVSWLREEDPTASFRSDRPALPLQSHPGLGVLRRAFRVVLRIAQELGKDGIGSVPKFFHDALIFYRSRLFLFLDGFEQGRFEALLRDLGSLSPGDASLALVGGCVRDASGAVLQWRPGLLLFPISPAAIAYFHAPSYGARVIRGFEDSHFTWNPAELARARATAHMAT